MVDFVGPVCLRTCTSCGESHPLEAFGAQPAGKYRRKAACRVCTARVAKEKRAVNVDHEVERARSAAWKLANPEKVREGRLKAYQLNREAELAKKAAWRGANRDKAKAYTRKWRDLNYPRVQANKRAWAERNKEKLRQAAAEKRRVNPAKHKNNCAIRKDVVARATMLWSDKSAILAIYASARLQGMSVDHLYPLRGKTVCGLHTHNNLRVIPKELNSRKKNKLPGVLSDELWDASARCVFHE